MNQPIKKFRSDICYFSPKLLGFGSFVSLLILTVGALGYFDFIVVDVESVFGVMVFLWLGLGFIYLFLLLMTYIFPVYIYRHGIKCYDYYGFYKEVEWNHIQVAYFESVGGIEYVFLDVEGLSTPVTIPLYLEGMDEFIRLVREYDRDGELAAYFGR